MVNYMLRIILGVSLFIIGLLITIISHDMVFTITRGDIFQWECLYYPLRVEFIKWIIMEILGIILLGIGLGILFYDLKKSILKLQAKES